MNAESLSLSDIAAAVTRLAGRRADDPELAAFLRALGSGPLPAFPPDELHVYVEDQARGCSLTFQDADSILQYRSCLRRHQVRGSMLVAPGDDEIEIRVARSVEL